MLLRMSREGRGYVILLDSRRRKRRAVVTDCCRTCCGGMDARERKSRLLKKRPLALKKKCVDFFVRAG